MSPKYDRPLSPASVNRGTSSVAVPLLSDIEATATDEEEKLPEVPSQEKKDNKAFSTAEYKIAFSHFLVRKKQSAFQPLLTGIQRIFSYSTKSDKLLLLAATTASICTGVTLPLMNVVFGRHSMLPGGRFQVSNSW